jgi:hypothetical protein
VLRWRFLPVFLILIIILPACTQSNIGVVADTAGLDKNIVSGDPPSTCPVTKPPDPPFIPPDPYPAHPPGNIAWYGAASLWTDVPLNGTWNTLPYSSAGYGQKVFWWRDGYSWTKEPEPNLTVSGRRLDAAAPPLHADKATNAYSGESGSAMLVGVDFPTLGCWEITGQYADAKLTFVVWVAP